MQAYSELGAQCDYTACMAMKAALGIDLRMLSIACLTRAYPRHCLYLFLNALSLVYVCFDMNIILL